MLSIYVIVILFAKIVIADVCCWQQKFCCMLLSVDNSRLCLVSRESCPNEFMIE